ncbi:MAG: tRNA pseudouridine(55) synthase TruB [Gammaproteobacteria bacterium]
MQRGRKRLKGKDITGVVLLDKPLGLSSNEALQRVKRLFYARKAGHTGSLDVLADGMLPVCFGQATKLTQFLLDADKHYVVRAQLGIKTATGDAEGEVIEQKPVEAFTAAQIEKVLAQFRGEQQQIPSMYSAIKHQGKPLYTYARQGITIERAPRAITIYALTMISLDLPYITFQVHSSKGTYIRTLVEDIGDALGCGAHVRALRRTQVAKCDEEKMVTLPTLEAAYNEKGYDGLQDYLQAPDVLVQHWPGVTLSSDLLFYLKQGQAVFVPQAPTNGWVRLLDQGSQCFGVGEVLSDGRIAPRRLLV